jgi:ribosomal protein S12 methylthiotransferase
LPQRYGRGLLDLLPEVDLFLGPAEVPHIVERLREIAAGGARACRTGPSAFLGEEEGPRAISSAGPSAYVKIAEGCSNRCTYCTIPSIRGPLRSRTISSVAREVQTLVRRGILEVVLVAQDTTAFGFDRCGKGELPSLLRVLDEIEGLRWIRLMYVHPGRVDEDLLKAFADSERMVPYLDMPIQHIDAQVLRRMNRRINPSRLRRTIQEIRQCRPGIHLRTSLMVGFPGETERAFESLVHFVEEVRFEWMGVFPFSPEEGTPAASMVPRVPKGVIRERCRRLMEVQRGITRESLARWVGKEVEVLIEGWNDTEGRGVGRTAFQAPEVDGMVFLEGKKGEQFKGIVRARITDCLDYDLVGRILDET